MLTTQTDCYRGRSGSEACGSHAWAPRPARWPQAVAAPKHESRCAPLLLCYPEQRRLKGILRSLTAGAGSGRSRLAAGVSRSICPRYSACLLTPDPLFAAATTSHSVPTARSMSAPPQKTPRPRTMQDTHWTTRPMVRPHRRRRSSYSSLSDAILRWRGIPSSSASSSCVGMPDRLAGMHGSCLHPQEQARLASHRRRSGSWPGSSRTRLQPWTLSAEPRRRICARAVAAGS